MGHHHTCVRVLPHLKKLDDCFGQFLVRVICDCGVLRSDAQSFTVTWYTAHR